MKKLYGAFDLHSTNNYLAIIDENDKRLFKRKLPNTPDVILARKPGTLTVFFNQSRVDWFLR